jgi:hypothetical protein
MMCKAPLMVESRYLRLLRATARVAWVVCCWAWLAAFAPSVRGEAMLQYFNTSWAEITDRMPELAEAGYTSLWLPPPTKGSGGLSVGYDLWDRFDLGTKDQRGSVRTRYGTEADLQRLIETAHRFGIRVYFDNIMNHNAFDIPGYNASTPIDLYPGFLPEDFHLQSTADGFYRKWDNTRDWTSSWQVQNLGLADLIDLSQELPNNVNFGPTEGSVSPKLTYVRHPFNPEYYPDTDLPVVVTTPGGGRTHYPFANKEPFQDTGWGGGNTGAGNGKFDWDDQNANGQHDAGEASEPFTDTGVDPQTPGRNTLAWGAGDGKYNMGNPVAEDVGGILIRSVRWLMDRTRADGLRLDAVKHVPDYFFGQTSGGDKDYSDSGYNGAVQLQFNLTRGFSDWDNHRNSVFETEVARDDAMLFGEHLGEPPGYSGYVDSGMRLVDNPLRGELNKKLGNPSDGLQGYDQPGAGGFAPGIGVMHAQSHDNDYAARRELHHAFYLTRAGMGIIYTDGNYHAGTLGDSGGAFPRHANTAFLGQFSDNRIPNLLYIHNQFARGWQWGRYADADYVAYERHEGSGAASNTVTMIFLLNDNYASGLSRSFAHSFPNQGGSQNDAYLYNYSSYGGGFYVYASALGGVVVPPGGYFAFAPRVPEQPEAFDVSSVAPIEFLQNGQEVGTVTLLRKDGPDGDPNFNPYSLPDTNAADYTYAISVPRVTATNGLTIVARADGSAENVLLRLDGGIDINSHLGLGPLSGDLRDNQPAFANDTFAGYEQARFAFRIAEKFAARDVARNRIGSPGAETYACTIGSTNAFTVNNGVITNFFGTNITWVYHDPVDTQPPGGVPQFNPAPAAAAGSPIDVWVKVGYQFQPQRAWFYYTTNGTTWPEGSGGTGAGETRVVELGFDSNAAFDGTGVPDWWKATVPALPAGTVLRYKIGVANLSTPSVYPSNAVSVTTKRRMETRFEITNLNVAALAVRKHNDYGPVTNGLAEGMHILRSRAFLKRDGKSSLYDTRAQTFYYDAQRPGGEILFPAADGGTIGGSEYGVVVRADRSVTEVWYSIVDDSAANDDSATGSANGNGATNWVLASEVTPNASLQSAYPREFRFPYRNIPSSGTADIRVRLRETSSAARSAFTATASPSDDTNQHYTTLIRNVDTDGENVTIFVAYPSFDGETVGTNYVMKVRFTKSLANGLSTPDLISRFAISIASTLSGSTNNAVPQPQSAFSINYDVTPDHHELAYLLPNLYNGDPSFLHTIVATHTRPAAPVLVSTRVVKAEPVLTPRVSIVNPAEIGSDGRPFQIVLPDVPTPTPDQRSYTIRVDTSTNVNSVSILFTNGLPGTVGPPVVSTNGASLYWDFAWTNLAAGTYQILALASSDGDPEAEASASRNATVVLRQLVNENASDGDDDDDGLSDAGEADTVGLPVVSAETWSNGQVHVTFAYGRSLPLSPDSDGDGLPDGLEVGWRGADTNVTNPAADTDGDGYPNFLPDLDPPFYNTVPDNSGVPGYSFYDSRTRQLAGSMTDPGNPDSDGDGLSDGAEDANRNGWTDGDGSSLAPNQAYNTRTSWPNRVIDSGENWLETDPNVADSDADGASDGYGEDTNFDGFISGDANTNLVYDAGEAWTETNPRRADTDGDSLPDGWEIQYGLDPLDNGTNSLRTALASDGNVVNGAAGDPDTDLISNLQEFVNGTNPRVSDLVPPPTSTNSLTIGPGPVIGTTAGVTWYEEFQDWRGDDLKALDEYDGNGSNKRSRDVWPFNDGNDSSRDIVAFYARDGGADGRYYFRVDFNDLKYQAEQGSVDVYVVVDTGNPNTGEIDLPDQVDLKTDMRWEAVVAAYSGNNGRVYVKTPGQPLGTGIETRGYTPNGNGFLGSYYRSDLDGVEFAISRQALLDAGWNGSSTLQFQVFTTRDGTQNSPLGAGDIAGRPDAADTIYDDDITESDDPTHNDSTLHYWFTSINHNPVNLSSYAGSLVNSARPNVTKVVLALSANQSVLNAQSVHDLVRNTNTLTPAGITNSLDPGSNPTGYARTLETLETFRASASLHLSGTLVSALQWAESDPARDTNGSRSGPAFNRRIRGLVQSNLVTLGSGFLGQHIAPYFTGAINRAAVQLQDDLMRRVFGSNAVSANSVLWTGERVLDGASLTDLAANSGHTHVLLDQMTHLWWWAEQLYGPNQGRNTALSDAGYQINRFNGMNAFLISGASDQMYTNHDLGPTFILRELIARKATAGSRDQVVILGDNWETAGGVGGSRSPDRLNLNVRWLANRPWVKLVTLEQIASQQVDMNNDGAVNGSDTWYVNDRGTAAFGNLAKDFVRHASQLNYDNWFNGSAQEESFTNRAPFIRTGVTGTVRIGRPGSPGTILHDAWTNTAPVTGSLSNLARYVYLAGIWEAAFHNEDSGNRARFSNGSYIYPDTTYDTLASFAFNNNARIPRSASLVARAAQWAASAPGSNTVATAVDADHDGDAEHILSNNRVYAVFERIGGRLIAAFARDPVSGKAVQVVGNLLSDPAREDEGEGEVSTTSGAVDARRTSGFKDWFASGSSPGTQYNNDVYTVAAASNGWEFVSADGKVRKTISLAAGSDRLLADYNLSGGITKLYVRHGFSPDAADLFVNGQTSLTGVTNVGGVVSVANINTAMVTVAAVRLADPGLSGAAWNSAATDRIAAFTTVPMRLQAQTHQIEIESTATNFTFALQLNAEAADTDSDGDGLNRLTEAQLGTDPANPDTDGDGMGDQWEHLYRAPASAGDGSVDSDGDGQTDRQESVAGTNPDDSANYLRIVSITRGPGGVMLQWTTTWSPQLTVPRRFIVWGANDLAGPWLPVGTTGSNPLPPNGSTTSYTESPVVVPRRYYKIEAISP